MPFRSLLPVHVASNEGDIESLCHEELFEQEVSAIGPRAVEKRKLEFAAGRNCARKALQRLGLERCPIPSGPMGEPIWPPNIVGSITHCASYCAAAVAFASDVRGIGIDVETHAPLPAGVADIVCVDSEQDWISIAPAADSVAWGTVIFSAKESLFKAWYPLLGRWLDFSDARLAIDAKSRSFIATLHCSTLDEAQIDANPVAGYFEVAHGLVFTAVVLPANPAA